MDGQISMSRRGLLSGASALAAAGALGGMAQDARAKAPLVNAPAPYFYRTKLGAAEVTVVSDGVLPLGDPKGAFIGLTPEEISRQLESNFLPQQNAVLEQNALVVNTGDKLVLIDTGMGTMKNFGPTTGKLLASLKQAGIDPKDIDAVVMSHAHIDHCGGNMADDGSRNFPNAQFYITQADYDYWTNEAKVPKEFRDFFVQANKNLVPNRDRMHFIKDGEEFLPGIQAIAAPGHTVGHTLFMISSGGKSMCYIGDLTHHPVLLLEKPLTEFAYDTDPKQSAQTRLKMLTTFAANRTQIVAYHFPWPGIGHISKQGGGFRYHPSAMEMSW